MHHSQAEVEWQFVMSAWGNQGFPGKLYHHHCPFQCVMLWVHDLPWNLVWRNLYSLILTFHSSFVSHQTLTGPFALVLLVSLLSSKLTSWQFSSLCIGIFLCRGHNTLPHWAKFSPSFKNCLGLLWPSLKEFLVLTYIAF